MAGLRKGPRLADCDGWEVRRVGSRLTLVEVEVDEDVVEDVLDILARLGTADQLLENLAEELQVERGLVEVGALELSLQGLREARLGKCVR